MSCGPLCQYPREPLCFSLKGEKWVSGLVFTRAWLLTDCETTRACTLSEPCEGALVSRPVLYLMSLAERRNEPSLGV